MDNREYERVAVLEERSEMQGLRIQDLVAALDALTREVTRINRRFERNMGFLGGMAFTFSLLGAILGAFGRQLFDHLTGSN